MPQIEDLGRIIDEHPFFRGIDETLRALLVGCAANERVEAGDYLFRDGAPADKFYLVRHGRIAIELRAPAKPPIIVETIVEGEVTGWSWMVEPHRWAFDGRAVVLTRVVSLDGACLRAKMDQDPALGYAVMRRFVPIIAQRLAATRLQLLDLYGPPQGQGGRA